MQKYLRVEYFHSTDPETDGNLTKKEAYVLAAQAVSPTRIVTSKEYLQEKHKEETWAEFYFKTATYYIIEGNKEFKHWGAEMFHQNFDFSVHHNLGKRFDSSLPDDGVKIVSRIPAGIQAMPLPKIDIANIKGY